MLYVKALEVTGAVCACNYTDCTKTPKAVPASGDIVFCNPNDDSTIGVVTAALLDDLFTVLMPSAHTNVFIVSVYDLLCQ